MSQNTHEIRNVPLGCGLVGCNPTITIIPWNQACKTYQGKLQHPPWALMQYLRCESRYLVQKHESCTAGALQTQRRLSKTNPRAELKIIEITGHFACECPCQPLPGAPYIPNNTECMLHPACNCLWTSWFLPMSPVAMAMSQRWTAKLSCIHTWT